VTFLGLSRLHATWIKPEVVATKKYTGYLHYRFITTGSWFLWSLCCSYMCFFEFLCDPANCLSIYDIVFPMFWTFLWWVNVIVLTFKEKKHLSDYRTVRLSNRRTIALSDCRIIGRTPLESCINFLHSNVSQGKTDIGYLSSWKCSQGAIYYNHWDTRFSTKAQTAYAWHVTATMKHSSIWSYTAKLGPKHGNKSYRP
jgi:hypothetical protein